MDEEEVKRRLLILHLSYLHERLSEEDAKIVNEAIEWIKRANLSR